MTFAHEEAQAGGVEGAGTGVMGVLAFEKPQKGFIRTAGEERGSGSWVHGQTTRCPSGRLLGAGDAKWTKQRKSPHSGSHILMGEIRCKPIVT